MQKLMFIFGTRPEAIKMAPVILEAKNRGFKTVVCLSGQHRDMVIPFMTFFQIKADHDLNVMKPNQSLAELTANIISATKKVLDIEKPDLVFVQGDTTTTFAGALAAFYEKIPVGHIEAGLRTYDKYSPFPEEVNRQMVSSFAELHFPPTIETKKNLEYEKRSGISLKTGNTSIDSLRLSEGIIDEDAMEKKYAGINFSKKLLLITVHRRENHGKPLLEICQTLKKLQLDFDLEIVLPVHLNPNVKTVIEKELKNIKGIHLLPPLDYPDFVFFMKKSFLIMTDSGGVQEEGPYFKKPILVMRENTERPEGIESVTSMLVGTNGEKIYGEIKKLITDEKAYNRFKNAQNPYGDGLASARIVDKVKKYFEDKK